MEDLVALETLQIGEQEDLLEKMEIQMEEMEVLTLMTVGMEMILHPQQILLLPEGEGIENPNMFMPGRATWTSRKRWQRWTSTAISQSPRRNFKGTKN